MSISETETIKGEIYYDEKCKITEDELKQDAIAMEINGEMYFI